MAVQDKTTLLTRINTMFGDNPTDDAISIIEDLTDTFDDFETKTKDGTDWQKKYTENDAAWRKKYRDRFFNPAPDEEEEEFEKPKQLTFDLLFKEG